jgi:S-adenosylmethionine synthetase
VTAITISQGIELMPAMAPVEIVERKGLGHPDTICDALAEALSLALCRYYRDHFGLILHHNVDKALLWGGVARPQFHGGEVIEPMEVFLAGRATAEFQGERVPIEELVVETSRQWFRSHFQALDAERHVRLHTMIRPGSGDLVDLYLRQQESGVALANDTSCGVGFAPLDELERLVFEVETYLNSYPIKQQHPYIGEDVKVMGIRDGDSLSLTVACALIDRHIADLAHYFDAKSKIEKLVLELAATQTDKPVSVSVNAADGEDRQSIYMTVTGTSAEAGDDGQVGRGNRVNGLITPYRPMNMEAAAGKNPVTHVGKCYNITAGDICQTIIETLPEVLTAQCFLVSRIGQPVTEPQLVQLRLQLQDGVTLESVRPRAEEITRAGLTRITQIQDRIVAGAISVY